MKVINSKYEGKSFIKKKYSLTGKTIVHDGRILKQIIANKDFGNIKAGTIGGYIQTIGNLSQEGLCWIYPDAKVYDEAYIYGNVQIDGQACIYGKAFIMGYGLINGKTEISDNVYINGFINISGITKLYGNVKIFNNNYLNNVSIGNNAILYGNNYIDKLIELNKSEQLYCCYLYDNIQ